MVLEPLFDTINSKIKFIKEEKIRKIGHIYKETFQGSRSDSSEHTQEENDQRRKQSNVATDLIHKTKKKKKKTYKIW